LNYLDAQPILTRLDLLSVILLEIGFGATRAITDLSNTARGNTYAIPVAMLMLALGRLMPMDRADDFAFLSTTYPIISMFLGLGVGLLLLISTSIKGALNPRPRANAPGRRQAGGRRGLGRGTRAPSCTYRCNPTQNPNRHTKPALRLLGHEISCSKNSERAGRRASEIINTMTNTDRYSPLKSHFETYRPSVVSF